MGKRYVKLIRDRNDFGFLVHMFYVIHLNAFIIEMNNSRSYEFILLLVVSSFWIDNEALGNQMETASH